MTRVIGGTAGGRRLTVPSGTATRPTSDRAREALFSALISMLGPGGLRGRRVLDLYAGSGAVGVEALSRGAERVLLVDSDRRAADTVRANVARLGLTGAQVVRDEVARLTAGTNPQQPYDVAFLDPPHLTPADAVRGVLSALALHGWLSPDALVVVERASRDEPWRWPPGFTATRDRRYGEATLWYGRAAWSGDDRLDPE
jgi:16S rRNA (guanine966-N2)-methyltransferase